MKFEPTDILLNQTDKITIREANISDASELISVVKRYIEDCDTIPYAKGEFNPSIEEEQKWIENLNHQSNSLLLLATHKGNIIGNISLNGSQREMMKHTAGIGIGIVKEWRGLGIGNLLFQKAIGWAKEHQELELLWLETYTTNKQGIALYKKWGFVESGLQKEFVKIGDGEYRDNLQMILKIR